MKKFLFIIVLVLLGCNTSFANVKNIGNKLAINIPAGYHYFEITLKQIATRFPSIDISSYINSGLGFGENAKLVILANNRKTIKLANDISTASGLAKLTRDYWEPILSLEKDSEFLKIIESYAKKKFRNIDLANASEEEWQKILITVINDKKFLKKIDKYFRPLIKKFNFAYEFDKVTFIVLADKKIQGVNELKKLSVSEARNLLSEGIKKMVKEDPTLKIWKDFKYKVGKNPKGNLYLYTNDIDLFDSDPLFKRLKYLKKSESILTIENKKLISITSSCIKECNSTDFLEIIGSTNLYERSITKNGSVSKPQKTENASDIVLELKKLNKLYKSGALTKDEFNKAKKKLLN